MQSAEDLQWTTKIEKVGVWREGGGTVIKNLEDVLIYRTQGSIDQEGLLI